MIFVLLAHVWSHLIFICFTQVTPSTASGWLLIPALPEADLCLVLSRGAPVYLFLVSGSFLMSVLKSIQFICFTIWTQNEAISLWSDCKKIDRKQAEITTTNNNVMVPPRKKTEFMLCQVFWPNNFKNACSLNGFWSHYSYAVLRHISKTYKAVWLPCCFPLLHLLNCPVSARVDALSHSSGCRQTQTISDKYPLLPVQCPDISDVNVLKSAWRSMLIDFRSTFCHPRGQFIIF